MEVAGLVIVVAVVILGLAALLWHVRSLQRSGPVVHVSAQATLLRPDLEDAETVEEALRLTATNTGRAPVQVTGWYLVSESGQEQLALTRMMPGSAPLPAVLERGQELSWFVEASAVARLAAYGRSSDSAPRRRYAQDAGSAERRLPFPIFSSSL